MTESLLSRERVTEGQTQHQMNLKPNNGADRIKVESEKKSVVGLYSTES